MRVILIDGKNAMCRFGWVGRQMVSEDGEPTGAVHGLLQGILSLKKHYPDGRFIMCWDGYGENWRLKLFPAYKAHRRNQPVTEEMLASRKAMQSQTKRVRRLLRLLSVPQLELDGVEADDLVGLCAARALSEGHQPIVYSVDQDYWQLVHRGVSLLKSTSGVPIGEKEIRAKFRCSPIDVLKVRALLGDATDGIPRAVPGVGPVSAAAYVTAGVDPSVTIFETLSKRVQSAFPQLAQHWKTVHLNYRLMRIPTDCADSEFPKSVQRLLFSAVNAAMEETLCGASSVRDGYSTFVALLGTLDLQAAIANRTDLWRLQK